MQIPMIFVVVKPLKPDTGTLMNLVRLTVIVIVDTIYYLLVETLANTTKIAGDWGSHPPQNVIFIYIYHIYIYIVVYIYICLYNFL